MDGNPTIHPRRSALVRDGHGIRRAFLALLASVSLMMLGLVMTGPSASALTTPFDDEAAVTAPLDVAVDPPADPPMDPSPVVESPEPAAGPDGEPGPDGSGGTGGGQGSGEPTEPTEPPDEPVDEGGHGDGGEPPANGEESAVRVCLATGNPESPYTTATVMPTAIINGEGRVKNGGPANSPEGVWPADGWGNIVPAVTHPSGASFGGLNWGTAGQEIWNDGCAGGEPSTPPEDHEDHEQVAVCLATGTGEAPYELGGYSATAIINGKGVPHPEGPASNPVVGVYPAPAWGNIVPPVEHPSGKVFGGLNWGPDGQRIWNAGCVYVAPVVEPEPGPPAPVPQPAAEPAPAPEPAVTAVTAVVEVVAPEPAVVPVPAVAPEPATLPAPAEKPAAATTSVPAPAPAAAPVQTTVPTAVNAGGGSTDRPGTPLWALLMVLIGGAGATAAAIRLTVSESA